MVEQVKFTEKTIDYAKNPRNQGDMADPTAIGEVSNPDCGDSTVIYLKVENDIITDVTFETFGCAAAVASSSILTEMIKGKTVEEGDVKKVLRNPEHPYTELLLANGAAFMPEPHFYNRSK